MRTTTSRTLAAVLGLGLVLAVTACGPSEHDETQAGATGPGASPVPDPATTDPEPEPEPSLQPGPDPDGDTAEPLSGTACLVGTWLVDNNHFGALLQGAASATGEPISVSDPSGAAFVTFAADGGYQVAYEGWTFTMSQEGMVMTVVRQGTDTGTYVANDSGDLTTSETNMGSVASMSSSVGTHEVPGEPSTTTGTFVCEGDHLEVNAEGATSILTRQ